MYEIKRRELKAKNFFAGDFPTLTESGTAGEAIGEYMPVAKNTDGEIIPVTAETLANIVGIAAAEAEQDTPVVYYMTGEFFADALMLPDGIETETLKNVFRKISIFLR